MRDPELPEASHAVAAPAAEPVVAPSVRRPVAAAIERLDGGEVIELFLKPSLWYIPVVAFSVVAAMLVICAVAFLSGGGRNWTSFGLLIAQAAALVAAARLIFAAMQWSSRLYVLTNRRVMCFRGVWNVSVSECPLSRISKIELHHRPYDKFLRLGSLRMTQLGCGESTGCTVAEVSWNCLARPAEIHEIIVRAVRKAQ